MHRYGTVPVIRLKYLCIVLELGTVNTGKSETVYLALRPASDQPPAASSPLVLSPNLGLPHVKHVKGQIGASRPGG